MRGDTISCASQVPGAAQITKATPIMTFLFSLLSYILTAMQIAIIARALFSWFDPTGRTPIGQFLLKVTDPIIVPIRRLLPSAGFVDFSPMVAIVAILILQNVLARVQGSG
jgi:YggT family protein